MSQKFIPLDKKPFHRPFLENAISILAFAHIVEGNPLVSHMSDLFKETSLCLNLRTLDLSKALEKLVQT